MSTEWNIQSQQQDSIKTSPNLHSPIKKTASGTSALRTAALAFLDAGKARRNGPAIEEHPTTAKPTRLGKIVRELTYGDKSVLKSLKKNPFIQSTPRLDVNLIQPTWNHGRNFVGDGGVADLDHNSHDLHAKPNSSLNRTPSELRDAFKIPVKSPRDMSKSPRSDHTTDTSQHATPRSRTNVSMPNQRSKSNSPRALYSGHFWDDKSPRNEIGSAAVSSRTQHNTTNHTIHSQTQFNEKSGNDMISNSKLEKETSSSQSNHQNQTNDISEAKMADKEEEDRSMKKSESVARLNIDYLRKRHIGHDNSRRAMNYLSRSRSIITGAIYREGDIRLPLKKSQSSYHRRDSTAGAVAIGIPSSPSNKQKSPRTKSISSRRTSSSFRATETTNPNSPRNNKNSSFKNQQSRIRTTSAALITDDVDLDKALNDILDDVVKTTNDDSMTETTLESIATTVLARLAHQILVSQSTSKNKIRPVEALWKQKEEDSPHKLYNGTNPNPPTKKTPQKEEEKNIFSLFVEPNELSTKNMSLSYVCDTVAKSYNIQLSETDKNSLIQEFGLTESSKDTNKNPKQNYTKFQQQERLKQTANSSSKHSLSNETLDMQKFLLALQRQMAVEIVSHVPSRSTQSLYSTSSKQDTILDLIGRLQVVSNLPESLFWTNLQDLGKKQYASSTYTDNLGDTPIQLKEFIDICGISGIKLSANDKDILFNLFSNSSSSTCDANHTDSKSSDAYHTQIQQTNNNFNAKHDTNGHKNTQLNGPESKLTQQSFRLDVTMPYKDMYELCTGKPIPQDENELAINAIACFITTITNHKTQKHEVLNLAKNLWSVWTNSETLLSNMDQGVLMRSLLPTGKQQEHIHIDTLKEILSQSFDSVHSESSQTLCTAFLNGLQTEKNDTSTINLPHVIQSLQFSYTLMKAKNMGDLYGMKLQYKELADILSKLASNIADKTSKSESDILDEFLNQPGKKYKMDQDQLWLNESDFVESGMVVLHAVNLIEDIHTTERPFESTQTIWLQLARLYSLISNTPTSSKEKLSCIKSLDDMVEQLEFGAFWRTCTGHSIPLSVFDPYYEFLISSDVLCGISDLELKQKAAQRNVSSSAHRNTRFYLDQLAKNVIEKGITGLVLQIAFEALDTDLTGNISAAEFLIPLQACGFDCHELFHLKEAKDETKDEEESEIQITECLYKAFQTNLNQPDPTTNSQDSIHVDNIFIDYRQFLRALSINVGFYQFQHTMDKSATSSYHSFLPAVAFFQEKFEERSIRFEEIFLAADIAKNGLINPPTFAQQCMGHKIRLSFAQLGLLQQSLVLHGNKQDKDSSDSVDYVRLALMCRQRVQSNSFDASIINSTCDSVKEHKLQTSTKAPPAPPPPPRPSGNEIFSTLQSAYDTTVDENQYSMSMKHPRISAATTVEETDEEDSSENESDSDSVTTFEESNEISVDEDNSAFMDTKVKLIKPRRMSAAEIKEQTRRESTVLAVLEAHEQSSSLSKTPSNPTNRLNDDTLAQEATDAITYITPEDIELLCQDFPSEDLYIAAAALCVLLHVPNPTWERAKKVMRKPGFLKKLAVVRPNMIDKEPRAKARMILKQAPGATKVLSDFGIIEKENQPAQKRKPRRGSIWETSNQATTARGRAASIVLQWCIVMAWWIPQKAGSGIELRTDGIQQELVEEYRAMGYKDPETAAAAAMAAAAAEAADTGDLQRSMSKHKGLTKEHVSFYQQKFQEKKVKRLEGI